MMYNKDGEKMRKFLAILIAKITIIIGKILKKGSVYPGSIALKIDKNIMDKFTLPKIVIAVTGSSGKGSTSKTIAHTLRKLNYSVVHNEFGSNLTNGIVTLLLQNCNLKGKIKKDILVFEIDERYTKIIFKHIKPQYVVITNLTRDQPPRQGNFDLVYEEIKKALTKDMHLILNGDDPYLQKFKIDTKCKITYYGIEKNKYSYNKTMFNHLNMNYCPICNNKLNYNYYNFETNGDYYCTNCDFKRPNVEYKITNLDYNKNKIIINDKYIINSKNNILYSTYNLLASFTTLSLIKMDKEKVCELLSGNDKSYDEYEYKKRKCYVLNNKNENASTFNQSLLFINRFKGKKTIVIGWKEISRRYKFDDLSWLYDVDFEILSKHDIDNIICVGINKYDIATRIKYSNINEKRIKTFDNLEKATNYIKTKTNGDIYGILNFDYVKPFNELMNGSDK